MTSRWVGYASWCFILILELIIFVKMVISSVMEEPFLVISIVVWLYCLASKVKQRYVLTLKEQGDVHVRRAAVLRALPAYLHEDDSTFLRLWHVSQHNNCFECMWQIIKKYSLSCYIVSGALSQEDNYLNFYSENIIINDRFSLKKYELSWCHQSLILSLRLYYSNIISCVAHIPFRF